MIIAAIAAIALAALACSLLFNNGGNDSREADPFETDIDLDTTYHKAGSWTPAR